jgi:hypothetical protein
MKKIGKYTLRGTSTETESESGSPKRIILFDGRFDTGYRITKFAIWGSTYASSTHPDVIGKLGTTGDLEEQSVDFMNASENREIAWAAATGGVDYISNMDSIIDPDNLVIEDLYVYVRNVSDGERINYFIEMDKYEFSDWVGALAMVRNRAQGPVVDA